MSKLEGFLGRQLAAADRSDTTREKLLDRYLGEPYGDEVEGRSKVITSEVFDVVETITAEMMDVLTSADQIVTFRPDGEEDEDAAQAETEACNAIFWEKNPGFENLQTWVKAGLIEQVGYVRSGFTEKRDVTIEEYRSVPALAPQVFLMQAEMDDEVTSVDIVTVDEAGTDEAGQPVVDFKAKVVRARQVYEIEPIPQDKVRITPRWPKQSLQECPFVAIEDDTKSRSDLIAMGFDPEQVDELGKDTHGDDRWQTEDLEEGENSANPNLTVFEVYALFDIDGDGIDERVRAWCSEKGKLLRWKNGKEAVEEVDSVPVYAWTPILVPHRHAGRSAAEITEDVQRQNSTLMRSLFDSIYATLYPRPVVDVTQSTTDTYSDLASPDHGAPVRVKGATAIQWTKAPGIAGDILPALQRMDAIKEERTGVTKLAQGLDKNALTNTATGQAALISQAMKRIKLIARNMAEYGLKDLFLGMHRDLRRGNWRAIRYKRAAGWAEADPTLWPPRAEMACSIGTGNGDKIEKIGALDAVIAQQKELIAAGSMLADEAQLYAAIDRRLRLSGLTGAGLFFLDPASPEYQQKAQAKAQQPPEPKPEMLLAQAENTKAQAEVLKAQVRQAEVQQQGQLEIANLQAAEARAQREHDAEMQRLALQIEQARLEVAQAASKEAREDRKVDLAEAQVVMKDDLERDKLQVEVAQDMSRQRQHAAQAERQEREGFLSRWFGGRK